MSGRDAILGSIRQALGRGPLEASVRASLAARMTVRPRGPIPARTQGDAARLPGLFVEMLKAAAASVETVVTREEVPAAIAAWLLSQNLPSQLRIAPALADLPWSSAPLLTVAAGRAEPADLVACTPALVGIAETGTLMLHSGATTPSTLNFLPDTHIVVLPRADIVGTYEEGWERLRRLCGETLLPRTVNFITGPSRTGDIEQKIQMGAHGPRRLHVVMIDS